MKNLPTILIVLLSTLIPLTVGTLYFIPKITISFTSSLSAINAFINGSTFILLIIGLISIKNKKITLHKSMMWSSLILSLFFLVFYILYHISTPPTKFGGEGVIKYIYYFILFSHIILAAVTVPLVLITFSRALSLKFDKHKKIAKVCLPIWLYVTLSGVVVYIMIYPYYSSN